MSVSSKTQKTGWFFLVVTLALLLCQAPLAIAADSLLEKLGDCAVITKDKERLDCYDSLASSAEPSGNASAAGQPGKEPTSSAMDQLGAERLPGRPKEQVSVDATVVSCSKDAYGQYIFHFDSGQVWKQTDDKKLYFKTCNFGVNIKKDFFGYKMRRLDGGGWNRISRIK